MSCTHIIHIVCISSLAHIAKVAIIILNPYTRLTDNVIPFTFFTAVFFPKLRCIISETKGISA